MANITAEQAIQAARDEHKSFGRVEHPDKVLARKLWRYQQDLLSRIAQIKKNAIEAIYEFDVAIHDFEYGEELPAHILIHGGEVTYLNPNVRPVPLTIRGFEDRLSVFSVPSAYHDRTQIWLNGEASDWTAFDLVKLRYFPAGAEITAPDQELDLPGQALNTCALHLAAFMAGKSTDETVPLQKLLGDAAAAESSYIDEITGRRRVSVYYPIEQ